jgi:cytochrome c biogenesis protein CcdA
MMLFVIGLAFVDCLNPTTIGAMALLLTLVKKVQHSLIFLASTFITYYMGGLALYFGIDRYLSRLIHWIIDRYAAPLYVSEIALGILLFGISLRGLIRQIRIRRFRRVQATTETPEPGAADSIIPFHPLGLFVFGVGSTLSDLPTAFPLLALIGKLVEARIPLVAMLLILFLYVLIYVLPLIVLYAVYQKKREQTHRLAVWFQKSIVWFNRYLLPPLLMAAGAWILYDGWISLEVLR